jgi:predicted nucleic acid-binding protein
LRLVLDSDVLVHALRRPKSKELHALHEKAARLFESCIERENELFLPTVIPIEVGTVLSKILPQDLAREGTVKLLRTTKEVYPYTDEATLNSVYSISSHIYFEKLMENSLKLSRITKEAADSWVPGWVDKSEVMIGGMDIFVLTYAELKAAVLITNDWALWYVAWKRGQPSYWLSGLRDEQVSELASDNKIEYPVQ